MSETPWIKTLKDGFNVLKDSMDYITKDCPQKRETIFFKNLKNFILAITGNDSKNACNSMIREFISNKIFCESIKKGIVIKDKDGARTQGEIFSNKDAKLLICTENDNQEKKTYSCELAKLVSFYYFIILGKKTRKDASPSEEKMFSFFNDSFDYFICCFAKTIGNYCLTTKYPNEEESKEIYKINNVEIPTKPSSNISMLERFMEVITVAEEDDVMGGVLSAVIGKDKLNLVKQMGRNMDTKKIMSLTQNIQKDIANKNGAGIIGSISSVVSNMASGLNTCEGSEDASSQEF